MTSLLCVSPNVTSEVVDGIKSVLGVNMTEGHSKYLGLSSSILHNKCNVF